jgi:Thermostable hemolysin
MSDLYLHGDTAPIDVRLLDRSSPARAATEAFITAHYAWAYGAQVRHFLPRLLALYGADGALFAALGFRSALGERLFLEHYLDLPAEVALSLHLGSSVPRAGMVEVGNLVTARPGGARWLIAALTAYLKAAGYDWAIFTAVHQLCNAFTRLGIKLVPLAQAAKERLPESDQASWGSYYETGPMVVAASVHQSFSALFDSIETQRQIAGPRHLGPKRLTNGIIAGAA